MTDIERRLAIEEIRHARYFHGAADSGKSESTPEIQLRNPLS